MPGEVHVAAEVLRPRAIIYEVFTVASPRDQSDGEDHNRAREHHWTAFASAKYCGHAACSQQRHDKANDEQKLRRKTGHAKKRQRFTHDTKYWRLVAEGEKNA